MKNKIIAAVLTSALALGAGAAMAQSAGDWTLGVGLGVVAPKDGNGTLAGGTIAVDVDDNVQPTFTFEYFVAENIGIEVLAATPFQHDISLNGLKSVRTKHLPPTVSLQYHIPTGGNVTPFVGAGINYTTFFDEKVTGGALNPATDKVSLADSFGLALHAGVDFQISDRGALRADVRWMNIDTDVKLNGTKIGTAEIDPMVFGVSYIHRF